MTFGEALLSATSFFWSPMIVALITVILAIICIVFCISEATYDEWLTSLLMGLAALVLIVVLIALITFFASNGIQPDSWEHTAVTA